MLNLIHLARLQFSDPGLYHRSIAPHENSLRYAGDLVLPAEARITRGRDDEEARLPFLDILFRLIEWSCRDAHDGNFSITGGIAGYVGGGD